LLGDGKKALDALGLALDQPGDLVSGLTGLMSVVHTSFVEAPLDTTDIDAA